MSDTKTSINICSMSELINLNFLGQKGRGFTVLVPSLSSRMSFAFLVKMDADLVSVLRQSNPNGEEWVPDCAEPGKGLQCTWSLLDATPVLVTARSLTLT